MLVAGPFGINAHIPERSLLEEMVEARIEWARIDVIWAVIEPEEGVYDWGLYDQLIDEAGDRGVRLYATLQGTPGWATDGDPLRGVPSNPETWQEFCYRAASRYRGRVDAWGFWNEPNNDRFWQGSRSEYIETILLRGVRAVRAVDPDALVCAPESAHLESGHWDDWLEEVIGAAGWLLDVVTHHVYPGDADHRDVTEDLDEDPDWPWEPPSVRKVLNDAGWGGQPFWLTETGVQSARHGEQAQAGFYDGLLRTWFGDGSDGWIDRVFFYELADGPEYPDISWGILGPPPERRRKPAYIAYTEFTATAATDGAEVIGIDLPDLLRAYEVFDGCITFRNTGRTTWSSPEYGVHAEMSPHSGWLLSIGGLPESVAPGESVTVPLTVGAPYGYNSDRQLEIRLEVSLQRERRRFGTRAKRAITLSRFAPLRIERQPVSVAAALGATVRFVIEVDSETETVYQWRRDSIDLEEGGRFVGVTSSLLEVRDVGRDVAGDYDCVVSNRAGSGVSRDAVLLVVGDEPPRRPEERRAAREEILRLWRAFRDGERGSDRE